MNKRTLTYFMWGYQPHFRLAMESRIRGLLDALGVHLGVKALLVGIRVPEVADDHPVCVEPEDADWDVAMFADCHGRVEAIFENHPDQSMFYGDEPTRRDQPERIRQKSVRQAVEEALAPYDDANAARSFCGTPTRVGNFHVTPVLQVARVDYDALPALPGPIRFQDWISPTSLVDALFGEFLGEATEALGQKEPGRFFDVFDTDAPGLLRQAARRFCSAIPLLVKDDMLQGVFDALNSVSAMRYEGGEAVGEVVFAPPDAASVECEVTFARPIRLDSHRHVRKLVEMSGDGLACLCECADGLKGLAAVEGSIESPVFRALFVDHYRWDLYFNNQLLMRCAYGVPELPSSRLEEEEFSSNVRRVLPGTTQAQAGQLWDAVSTAMDQKHGTMFVVSDAAASEAARLESQAIAIKPTALTTRHVQRLSGIDGAILVDRDGVCYAVGVILDGLATNAGDPSRGARYNSAIRYANSSESPTLCVVVSEDGYVNMIPTLRAQIDRRELESKVAQFRVATADTLHEARNWLDRHRFYLSAEQCDVVNEALARLEPEVLGLGQIWVVLQPFKPSSDMNASYFSGEPANDD